MKDNPNYSYISTLRTPDGGTHYLKDSEAREAVSSLENRMADNEESIESIIESVKGGTRFVGITTSPVTDGSTMNTIAVDGQEVSVKKGDFTILMKAVNGGEVGIEFIWTGNKWSELGSIGTLKALAFKDSASGSVVPQGVVSAPKINTSLTKETVAVLSVALDVASETLTISNSSKIIVNEVAVTSEAPVFTGKGSAVTVS